ncbi:ribonuclease H-like protein [Saitoella complicata NRRL Y-17804]|nr:ribonuclease H-like protein [Saitoella complicata NRRL Y-17804]ODQ52784.1 ribonuclease H-like protein [Saitoella complicata NRRL Y-17804]
MFTAQGLFGNTACPKAATCDIPACFFKHPVEHTFATAERAAKKRRVEGEEDDEKAKDVLAEETPVKKQKVEDEDTGSLLRKKKLPTPPPVLTTPIEPEAPPTVQVEEETTKEATPVPNPGPVQPVRPASPTPTAPAPPAADKPPPTLAKPALASEAKGKTTAKATPLEPAINISGPIIPVTFPACSVPNITRQPLLAILEKEYLSYYGVISGDELKYRARKAALKREEEIVNKHTKLTYKNAMKNAIIEVKKRPRITLEDLENEGKEVKQKIKGLGAVMEVLETFVMTDKAKLAEWDYIIDIPTPEENAPRNEEGCERVCDRCGKRWIVKGDLDDEDKSACQYHYGKPYWRTQNGAKQQVYSCCTLPMGEKGCTRGCHVFKLSYPPRLQVQQPFLNVPAHDPASAEGKLPVVSFDCEMSYTTAGLELTRITALDHEGTLLFDELIRPPNPVLDLNTRFSGVSSLESATCTLQDVRTRLLNLIDSKTILLGHGLENDLTALRIIHNRVIDTAILYPHPRGRPIRNSLKYLAERYLCRQIQKGDGNAGHDSREDAEVPLELVRVKAEEEMRRRSLAKK